MRNTSNLIVFMVDTLEKQLETIGLQEKEAKVYLATLELGQATVQQIATKADIKRPTTYFIIEGLMVRGLVASFIRGKRQYFVAENPERLLALLDEERQAIDSREERLKTFLPQLKSLNNRHLGKPVVKYYEGKEGIVAMVHEHTKRSSGQSLYAAYSRDAVEGGLGVDVLQKMREDRAKHKITARRIYTYSKGDMPGITAMEAHRLSEEEFPVTCDIAIYEDMVRVASFKDRMIGVVIEDKEIARSFRAIYDLAWKWVKQNRQ